MRVAFLTHEPFYPPSGGGSAEAIYLVQELVRRGHETHIFCPLVKDMEAVQNKFHVTIHPFQTWEMGRYTKLRNPKYVLYPFFLAKEVERASRRTSFDVILSQHAISAVAAGLLKKRLKVPVFMNFLDYLTGFMETWPAYMAPPPLLALLKRYELSLPSRYDADGLLTVSDTLADFFADKGYPREKIRPIYYGYDAALFPYVERRSAPERPVIAMHGSFDQHHLGAVARDAVKHVIQSVPNATFRFVGHHTDALKSFLGKLHGSVPAANIQSTGFVPYDKVSVHLQDATVGMVPYEESVGTHCAFVAKIVEYLASGLPVASTPLNSAMRYFKGEPMVKFAEFNGASLGAKIVEWLRQPVVERVEPSQAIAARVRQELDWQAISSRAVDFVEQGVRQ
ncbi:MAG TPA: glycosyltransferase family 4 protein [Methylomirabilota bacterium]|nr:glycosyltransferase family 4 protein [Methylomirabilota bacterium]